MAIKDKVRDHQQGKGVSEGKERWSDGEREGRGRKEGKKERKKEEGRKGELVRRGEGGGLIGKQRDVSSLCTLSWSDPVWHWNATGHTFLPVQPLANQLIVSNPGSLSMPCTFTKVLFVTFSAVTKTKRSTKADIATTFLCNLHASFYLFTFSVVGLTNFNRVRSTFTLLESYTIVSFYEAFLHVPAQWVKQQII